MITTREILKEYLEADRAALRRKRKRPALTDVIWKYEIALRHNEYHFNVRNAGWLIPNFYHKALHKIWDYRMFRLGLKTGFQVIRNGCGKGLCLAHIGPVIINGDIGEYCRIHVGVNIGVKAGTTNERPKIGNRVYIGPGAKLFGSIVIADDIAIGANAVVTKSFEEPGISIAGIPAKRIGDAGSEGMLFSGK